MNEKKLVSCVHEHDWGSICQHSRARPPFDAMCTCARVCVCVSDTWWHRVASTRLDLIVSNMMLWLITLEKTTQQTVGDTRAVRAQRKLLMCMWGVLPVNSEKHRNAATRRRRSSASDLSPRQDSHPQECTPGWRGLLDCSCDCSACLLVPFWGSVQIRDLLITQASIVYRRVHKTLQYSEGWPRTSVSPAAIWW